MCSQGGALTTRITLTPGGHFPLMENSAWQALSPLLPALHTCPSTLLVHRAEWVTTWVIAPLSETCDCSLAALDSAYLWLPTVLPCCVLFLLLFWFLLAYSWFAMLCYFLLYPKVNQIHKYIYLLSSTSWEICMQVKNNDWFQIGKGVRQGCILSPGLFNL